MRAGTSVLLVAVVLAGCSGDSKAVEQSQLPRLVLQADDLPAPFQRFDEGRLAQAEQPDGPRSDASRFGRIEGWKSRWRRPGGADTRGPLVVESRADLFESGGGAKGELEAIADEGGVKAIDRGLGDDAVVVSKTQAGFPRPLRTFVVSWRSDNVVGAVTVNGFQGRVDERDALRLARRQQARIAAAAR